MRVIVTGSRDWPQQWAHYVLDDLTTLLKDENVRVLTVVHGKCPTGADEYAHQWCQEWEPMATFLGKDVIEEPHPAAWNTYGPAAGPIRNQEMVDLGGDLLHGLPDRPTDQEIRHPRLHEQGGTQAHHGLGHD